MFANRGCTKSLSSTLKLSAVRSEGASPKHGSWWRKTHHVDPKISRAPHPYFCMFLIELLTERTQRAQRMRISVPSWLAKSHDLFGESHFHRSSRSHSAYGIKQEEKNKIQFISTFQENNNPLIYRYNFFSTKKQTQRKYASIKYLSLPRLAAPWARQTMKRQQPVVTTSVWTTEYQVPGTTRV